MSVAISLCLQIPNQEHNGEARRSQVVKIEVRGWCGPRSTPENEIADMLRYDDGTLESVTWDKDKPRIFVAVVDCKHYTKARWSSFMLRTKVL